MRTRQEALERMRFLEAVLPARARDTRRLEAELADLSMSLTDRTHDAICDAIDDAFFRSGRNPSRSAAPADLTESADEGRNAAPADLGDELAAEGSNADDDDDPFGGSDDDDDDDDGGVDTFEALGAGVFPEIQMGQTVMLALLSIKDHIGPDGLVKFVIEAAVRSSNLGAEKVLAAAFEAIPEGDLTVQDVVMGSLQAAKNARDARNTRNISAREILGPAVAIASSLGSEVPVIIKEAFVAASSKLDSSMLRSCLLSVLGCAIGMGMTSGDIEDLMKAFSREVKFGAPGQRAADGLSAQQDTSTIPPRSPSAHSTYQSLSQYVNSCRSSGATALISAKRSAIDDEDEDNDGARPSKKIKTESEDHEGGGE